MLGWLLMLAAGAADPLACHAGAYRLDDGSSVDVAVAGDALRWRRVDGRTGQLRPADGGSWHGSIGWSDRPDPTPVAFGSCQEQRIVFAGRPGTRIAFEIHEDHVVTDDGARLAGRLVLPPGDDPVPIVVLVHGSERSSALATDWMQRLLPAEGVGVFVYDKRGTGDSEGTYTQDFDVLARDAVSATHQARAMAGARAGRIGYRGASQGGWVAPLAASLAPVDFVIVVFGLAVSPLQQDREAVEFQMRAAGHGPEVVAQAREISDAAGVLVSSGFREGLTRFIDARERHRDKPWYRDLRGNLTALVLPQSTQALSAATALEFPMSEAERAEHGPVYITGTPWHYDGMDTLRHLRVPQLWMLGGQDEDAPSAETLRRLRALAANGMPITSVLFPDAEHGMTDIEIEADGTRVALRYPAGYLPQLLAFARGAGPQGIGQDADGGAPASIFPEAEAPAPDHASPAQND